MYYRYEALLIKHLRYIQCYLLTYSISILVNERTLKRRDTFKYKTEEHHVTGEILIFNTRLTTME